MIPAAKTAFFVLFLAVGMAGSSAAQATGHELPKNSSLYLPAGGQAQASWAWIAGEAESRLGRFGIGPGGSVWYADDKSMFFEPATGKRLKVNVRVSDFAFLNEELIVATSLGLGTLEKAPAGATGGAANVQPMRFKLAFLLPSPSLRVATGPDGTLYVARKDPRKGKTVVLAVRGLRSLTDLKDGTPDVDNLLELDRDVSALAGAGESVYVASGRLVVKATKGAKEVESVFLHPKEMITGFAYVPGAGLFYATASAVGYVSAGSGQEFLESSKPRIAAHNDALYVLLEQTKDILMIQGLEAFAKQ